MPNFVIRTETFSDQALFPRRQLQVGDVTVDTPTKAIPVKKLREGETLAPESRGVNELYRTVDTEKLTNDRRRSNSKLANDLQGQAERGRDDDLTVAFVSYDETHALRPVEAEQLVDVMTVVSDIITLPLFSNLAGAVDEDDGTRDASYQSYKRSVTRFLSAAKERAPDAPLMGVIPTLGREFTDDLMRVYEDYDVRAYCVNFNRRRITAGRQVSMIKPMMYNIARQGIEEQVMFYGINLHPGDRDDALGLRPAADMAAVGMGFDIVGENHVSPPGTAEVFEQMGSSKGDEDSPTTFRLFDKEEYAYAEIPLDDLPQHFPNDSAFDPDGVVRTAARSDNLRRRLQKVVNAEQMGLAAAELQDRISSGDAFDHVNGKAGVTPKTAKAFNDVRGGFDDGASQTDLSEF